MLKKIFFTLFLFVGFQMFSHAQENSGQTAKKQLLLHCTSTPAATAAATKPATAAATATPTKKDGTPDMRYKSNKDAAKAAPATTHTKKDGTPDERYKENKK